MGELGLVVRDHLFDIAGELLGSRAEALSDENARDVAAALLGELAGGGEGRERSGADPRLARLRLMLNENENGSHQITLASLWSLPTSSSTLATLTPALRAGGAAKPSTFTRGARETPRSAGESSLISFFLAAMMPLREA